MATNSLHNDLFSSLISDIKSYSGKDPLFPWLRGIKKMKDTLPSNILREKLPRFLQKCTQTFESDCRYKNDMDYVDEPRALLRTMEMNSIGSKRSLFYQAYALYYEKMKKFEEAEKMYLLGVQNLAEPIDELQKSYEQFLHRMERHKNKKVKESSRTGRRPLSARKIEENNENAYNFEHKPKKILNESKNVGILGNSSNIRLVDDASVKDHDQKIRKRDVSEQQMITGKESDKTGTFHGDDTVFVVKFVDTAIVGKSEAEDACHHGLVDPTINMKEAMNAINNMFKEPIETAPINRRSQRSQVKENNSNNVLNVFVDESFDDEIKSSYQKEEKDVSMMQQKPLQIFMDDKESGENEERTDENDNSGSCSSAQHFNAFVFPCPKDLPDDIDTESLPQVKLREDTVVHRFVGSTILDEPAVENVCHHGLVDPTINLKEAMDDINNMFGKPMDFVRRKRPKKQEKASVTKQEQDFVGFSILPDDDLETQKVQPPAPAKSSSLSDTDLFEPTMFTKEAMDDINKMFGMSLDF
ncbi:probable inactive serine/threonine-protein kinase bub1 isoform X2 [Jatropha curcas]|uniref:probable inactive serine/threonine-protein kinase bub1 isoform X2 n=1 Tax=Jatropha curcas TaxID=180498 RepID=UPI0005FBF9DB|nr:probable inactive serine/threonine-protein kinase bub1 isoform X2 [Jatropha curcas]